MKKYEVNHAVRLTADCPIIDFKLIDKMLKFYSKTNFDYVSNIINPTFPDGLDIEIFSKKCLFNSYKFTKSKFDKEHVTTFIRKSNKYKKFNFRHNVDLSNLRSGTKYNLTLRVSNDVIKDIYSESSDLKISEFTTLPSSKDIGIDISCNITGNYANITTPDFSNENVIYINLSD